MARPGPIKLPQLLQMEQLRAAQAAIENALDKFPITPLIGSLGDAHKQLLDLVNRLIVLLRRDRFDPESIKTMLSEIPTFKKRFADYIQSPTERSLAVLVASINLFNGKFGCSIDTLLEADRKLEIANKIFHQLVEISDETLRRLVDACKGLSDMEINAAHCEFIDWVDRLWYINKKFPSVGVTEQSELYRRCVVEFSCSENELVRKFWGLPTFRRGLPVIRLEPPEPGAPDLGAIPNASPIAAPGCADSVDAMSPEDSGESDEDDILEAAAAHSERVCALRSGADAARLEQRKKRRLAAAANRGRKVPRTKL